MTVSTNMLTAAILVFLLVFTNIIIVIADYRSLDGQFNNRGDPKAGTPQTPFTREIAKTLWQDDFKMISTPGEYDANAKVIISCADNLLDTQYPLPRCISNVVNGLQAKLGDEFKLDALEEKKSKRKTSHMLTFWGQFANQDIVNSASILNTQQVISIPIDDNEYTSLYTIPPANLSLTDPFSIPFNRSSMVNGVNNATSFLDGSLIYGVNNNQLLPIRDTKGGRGKFNLIYSDTPDGKFGYPQINDNDQSYTFAINDFKGKNVFLSTIILLFMREHNRRCDELFQTFKNNWDDERYFQEARRWTIAIIQRITYLEYLSTVLGAPLEIYSGYKPELKPSIDTFFSTVTSRYGHSEMSDVYNIVNNDGYKLVDLPLNSLQIPRLIEQYGVPTLILSMAFQRQEEVDIFFADQMRNFRPGPKSNDIASIDIIRSRDRGIPSYNDARRAFQLDPAKNFNEISKNSVVQDRLKKVYGGNVEKVESFIGGLAEDHLPGSILGPLFHKSFLKQWTLIRDSDRFWFEAPDSGFSPDEINIIRNTTLLSVVQRNTPENFNYPTNLWSVQPRSTNITNDGGDYPPQNVIKLSDIYEVRWVIVQNDINFKLTIASTNAWFGIGFNSYDEGMKGADMIVAWNKDDKTVYAKNYKSNDYEPPQVDEDNQFIKIIKPPIITESYTQVEISRPLNAPKRPPISNNLITVIYAWNPNSKDFSYHNGNRGSIKVNFFSGETSSDVSRSQTLTQKIHGIAMFIVWGIIFPGSIFIVRYLKHIDTYMSQHRNLQMLGGVIVITFGAAAMATVPRHGRNPHGIIGLLVYITLFIQIGLGILAIWGLAFVESASTGIVVGLKHLHFYLGSGLMVLAWAQIFLGLKQYGAPQPMFILYSIWLAILAMSIVVAEYVYKYKNMQFLWPIRETGDKNKRLHSRIPEDVYEQLPAITWNDFNLRVMAGAHLVVAEGLVFDIHKWIKIHPGGQRILRRVIGTDITQDFFFDPTDQIVINRAFSENEKIMQQIESDIDKNTLKKRRLHNAIRPTSIANAVDLINSTTFKNSRVAMHRHSKFATAKLATMVVARISDMSDDYSQRKKDDTFSTNSLSPTNNLTPISSYLDNSPYIFRRYILTNIELSTRHDAENPVKKLTFQVIHPKDKLPKFLPGDYIEIMSYVNKHVVIRPYTPLQGPSDKTFTILVKVYKDGAMSQHLGKQLRNFEIAVRGPFDIAERMQHTVLPQISTSMSSQANLQTSPIIRPTSPNLARSNSMSPLLMRSNSRNFNNPHLSYQPSHFGLDSVYGDEVRSAYGGSNVSDNYNRILLNPARGDQCWDVLFMICGGTGLTPMLQLIQYHFDCADNLKSNFKLHLLCANTQIADVISMKYLDFLASTSDGKLTVTHTLTKPPPIWKGLTGHIDDSILFNWMTKHYQLPPPAIPPRVNPPVSSQSQSQMLLTSTYNPSLSATNLNEPLYDYHNSSSPVPVDATWQLRRDNSIMFNNNEINILSERQEFMKMLCQDTTQSCKVVVCGPHGMMEGVKRSLERICFPVDTKALFIQ